MTMSPPASANGLDGSRFCFEEKAARLPCGLPVPGGNSFSGSFRPAACNASSECAKLPYFGCEMSRYASLSNASIGSPLIAAFDGVHVKVF